MRAQQHVELEFCTDIEELACSRDAVEVTLKRDYKWWVEAMRDVAVAVEQVSVL
jgi:hypothetical protein